MPSSKRCIALVAIATVTAAGGFSVAGCGATEGEDAVVAARTRIVDVLKDPETYKQSCTALAAVQTIQDQGSTPILLKVQQNFLPTQRQQVQQLASDLQTYAQNGNVGDLVNTYCDGIGMLR